MNAINQRNTKGTTDVLLIREKKTTTHYPLPESDAVTTQTCAPYYGDEIINTISS